MIATAGHEVVAAKVFDVALYIVLCLPTVCLVKEVAAQRTCNREHAFDKPATTLPLRKGFVLLDVHSFESRIASNLSFWRLCSIETRPGLALQTTFSSHIPTFSAAVGCELDLRSAHNQESLESLPTGC